MFASRNHFVIKDWQTQTLLIQAIAFEQLADPTIEGTRPLVDIELGKESKFSNKTIIFEDCYFNCDTYAYVVSQPDNAAETIGVRIRNTATSILEVVFKNCVFSGFHKAIEQRGSQCAVKMEQC